MKKIAIGIPMYNLVSPETCIDYMRMCLAFGRNYPEYYFYIIWRTKSEQFRARNGIVDTARLAGCDYLLFLDDDHFIDWRNLPQSDSYEFLHKMLEHKKPIVGALYFHRGGQYKPVVMKKVKTAGREGYAFLKDNELKAELQEVDVTGGGCMLIDMKVFDKIEPPYFEPEMQTSDEANFGTDIQLCRKAQEAGFKVYCDTSIILGHVRNEREVVTPANRTMFMSLESIKSGLVEDWMLDKWIKEYRDDACEYTGYDIEEMLHKGMKYGENHDHFDTFEDKEDYYRATGVDQICRQVWFNTTPEHIVMNTNLLGWLRPGKNWQGIDYGCGTSPVGFELLRRGNKVDFVDIDGASGYEFLKWRVKKYKLEEGAGFDVQGPYNWAIFMDSLEHIKEWEPVLDNVIGRMVEQGVILTNFFSNHDFRNAEHVNMNHDRVGRFLTKRHVVPLNENIWIKNDNFMGGPKNVRNFKQGNRVRSEGAGRSDEL